MPLLGRVLLGGFAIFMVWSLCRAIRDGVIFIDGVPCNGKEQPTRFAGMAALDVIGIVAFSWLAAGSSVTSFWHLLASE
jgi:hypothetical protein